MICTGCGEQIRHLIDSQTREISGRDVSWHLHCFNANGWRETFALGEEEKRLQEETHGA
jgi:hypothetical protein